MKKICIRVDANSTIGQGHVMRCLTLADEIKRQGLFSCLFVVSEEGAARLIKERGYEYVSLNIDYKDYSETALEKLKNVIVSEGVDVCLIDNYHVTKEFTENLKSVCKVAAFFYLKEELSADLLINMNIDADTDFYERTYKDLPVKLLLGPAYAPLRPEFCTGKPFEIKNEVKEVLFLTGGSDSSGVASNFIDAVNKAHNLINIHFTVVVGGYSLDSLDALSQKANSNISVIPAQKNISDFMKTSDIVVSAGGTTMYELSSIGVPSIIYSLADNQTAEAAFMGEKGNVLYAGSVFKDGFYDELISHFTNLVSDKNARLALSKNARSVVDGNGAERIAKALWSL